MVEREAGNRSRTTAEANSLSSSGTSPSERLPIESPGDAAIQFLADLKQLAADRAGAEAAIEARYRAAANAAGEGASASRAQFAQSIDAEQQALESELQRRRALAERRFLEETSSAERDLTDTERHVLEEFETGGRTATRTLDEARWEADALYDAHKHVAPKQLEEFERQVAAWLSQAEAERDGVQSLLVAWKQEDVAFPPEPAIPPPMGPADSLAQLQAALNRVIEQHAAVGQLHVPAMAANQLLIWIYMLLVAVAAVLGLGTGWSVWLAGASAAIMSAAGVAGFVALSRAARAQVLEHVPPFYAELNFLTALARTSVDDMRARTTARQTELGQKRERARAAAQERHERTFFDLAQRREAALYAAQQRYDKTLDDSTARRNSERTAADSTAAERRERLDARRGPESSAIEEHFSRRHEQNEQRYLTQKQTLLAQWQAGVGRLLAAEQRMLVEGGPSAAVADWSDVVASPWTAPSAEPAFVRFGTLLVRLRDIPQGLPLDPELAAATPADFRLLAGANFHDRPSLLFKAKPDGRRLAVEAMQSYMLRLLLSLPPGKARFTIIDPAGLGENFAAFMHLADDNEALVSHRIWTEPRHIEQRLADLSEHMENVIQKYLRNEFVSIEHYNRDAGEIAEPFRFLVVANYPVNFTEAAQRRLSAIATSGARCGLYTIVMADMQEAASAGGALHDLEQHSHVLTWRDGRYVWKHPVFRQLQLTLDAPAPAAVDRPD